MSAPSASPARWLGSWLLLGACTAVPDQFESNADASLVVGVVPYDVHDHYCKQSATRESAFMTMDDEDGTHCSYATGDFGEGEWVSPQAAKVTIPDRCDNLRDYTTLRFCRAIVASDAFRPLTTDPRDASRFYATLKFGDRCPPHAIEITKHIVNEDIDNKNQPVPAGDLLYPNEVTDELRGNYTELVFCFFRAAPSPEETMLEFPDLGFPYAVFHDFDGPQPSFVIRKRWIYSDDSNQTVPSNYYEPEASADVLAFREIVENPRRETNFDTCFDLGRVR